MSYKQIKRHIGHEIVCVGYQLKDKSGKVVTRWENVAIECDTCSQVLVEKRGRPRKVKVK